MGKMFRLSVQGMNQDLGSANGNYDRIELGEVNADDLYSAFQKYKAVKELEPKGDEDLCPPSLYVSFKDQEYFFYLDNGEITCGNNEVKVSPMEAVNLVSGFVGKGQMAEESFKENTDPSKPANKKMVSQLAWGSDHPEIKGMTPVRKKDLPPTDKDEFSGFNVDTKNSPQISVEVYKSDLTKGLPIVLMVFGILMLVVALGLLTSKDSRVAGMVFVFVGGGLIWFRSVVRKWVRAEFNLGFDWKANALWAKRQGDKQAIMVGNANCITDFTLTKHTGKRQVSRDFSDTMMERATKNAQTDTVWILETMMSNGKKRHAFDFYVKKEAEEVFEKARVLLNQQN